jgi:hypothetical protein
MIAELHVFQRVVIMCTLFALQQARTQAFTHTVHALSEYETDFGLTWEQFFWYLNKT